MVVRILFAIKLRLQLFLMKYIILDYLKKTNLIFNYKTVQKNNNMLRRIITSPIYAQLLLLKTAFFGTTIRVDNSFDTAMND